MEMIVCRRTLLFKPSTKSQKLVCSALGNPASGGFYSISGDKARTLARLACTGKGGGASGETRKRGSGGKKGKGVVHAAKKNPKTSSKRRKAPARTPTKKVRGAN